MPYAMFSLFLCFQKMDFSTVRFQWPSNAFSWVLNLVKSESSEFYTVTLTSTETEEQLQFNLKYP